MTSLPVHLNENGPVPLHRQLKEVLIREINGGQYQPGTKIPSERALCHAYGVSRTTVRQTVNDLVHEGRLLRIPAKGTFVAPPKIEQDLARVSRFSETIVAAGRTPKIRILSSTRLTPGVESQRALELSPGEEVVRLDVVGYADESPLVFYRVYLPEEYGDPIAGELMRAQAAGTVAFSMILDSLKRITGLTPTWVIQSYESIVADAQTVEHLALQSGDPVFSSTRTIYADEGIPVEYDEILYRGDSYRFTIRRAYPHP